MSFSRYLATALAVSLVQAAKAPTGTIEDVEHIVVFMQENRAFDHYYGNMRGVRGFNDRAAPLLPSGLSPFYQPIMGGKDPHEDYLLPYPLLFEDSSASCMGAPTMAYDCNMHMLNGGLVDGWNTKRLPGYGMSYFNRTDLPFYYALADAFTVGDQYFQSTFTATCPNREHLFSGSNGLSKAMDPATNPKQYCMLDDSEPDDPGFGWETMAETLMKHNVSWKLYQGEDNFDDNAFAWFDSFRHAQPGEPLYDLGMARVNSTSPYGFVEEWEKDIASGNLAQVTWLVGPAALSEHANNHPADGEDLSARIIDVLRRHPDVYSKTVFILNYDEGGQFYDHVAPPIPPAESSLPQHSGGKSTVTTEGELTLKMQFGIPKGHPIGLGWRVPLFLISPWSRGDLVYSEVADHTSVIQFIEKRFGVRCPNISPWRRAVTGDLTAAFDFSKPDLSWPDSFPDTSGNVNASKKQCDENPPPKVPETQRVPGQEPGVKQQRAIPSYVFDTTDSVADGAVSITMTHAGTATATAGVFSVYNRDTVAKANNYNMDPPKMYTVQGAQALSDSWAITAGVGYELHLHGPNGFVRIFQGNGTSDAALGASLKYNPAARTVDLSITNAANAQAVALFTVTDNAYGANPSNLTVAPGGSGTARVDVSSSGNWYDITVQLVCESPRPFLRRFMGKMETGETTTTDPAMAKGVPALGHEVLEVEKTRVLPPMPAEVTALNSAKWTEEWGEAQCRSARGKYKDICWMYWMDHNEL